MSNTKVINLRETSVSFFCIVNDNYLCTFFLKLQKSEKVRRDHDNVRRLYKELINSHRLGSSFSRGSIYEDLADKTGYSERQVQRILTEY